MIKHWHQSPFKEIQNKETKMYAFDAFLFFTLISHRHTSHIKCTYTLNGLLEFVVFSLFLANLGQNKQITITHTNRKLTEKPIKSIKLFFVS